MARYPDYKMAKKIDEMLGRSNVGVSANGGYPFWGPSKGILFLVGV